MFGKTLSEHSNHIVTFGIGIAETLGPTYEISMVNSLLPDKGG